MVNGAKRLPDGWEWTTVGECSTVITGRTPSKKDDSNYGNFMPFVKPPELLNGSIYTAEDNISEKGTNDARVLPVNAVLVSCIGNLGKTGINRVPVAFNQQINAVVFPENIIPEFGFYYFQSSEFKQQLEEISSATTVAIVNKSKFESLPFPVAPLPEQERIVAKIEELFTQLEAGTSALERVQAGLRRYKASVLKDAFEGKLVPQQQSGESVAELLERVIGKDYEKKITPAAASKVPYVPSGWIYGKLENLIYIAGRIGWRGLKADEYTEDGPMFLSVYNLNKGDHVDFSDTYHISQERYDESPEIMLCENDILLAKDGAGIGKIGIVKGLPGLATVNSSLLVIRASEIFVPEFLFYFLKGPQMQDVVRARITGSATPHLFQRDIKQFTLLIPPLEEQRRIVAEVERRLSVAREVESVVEKTLVRAGRLRQAVLKSAFEERLA